MNIQKLIDHFDKKLKIYETIQSAALEEAIEREIGKIVLSLGNAFFDFVVDAAYRPWANHENKCPFCYRAEHKPDCQLESLELSLAKFKLAARKIDESKLINIL